MELPRRHAASLSGNRLAPPKIQRERSLGTGGASDPRGRLSPPACRMFLWCPCLMGTLPRPAAAAGGCTSAACGLRLLAAQWQCKTLSPKPARAGHGPLVPRRSARRAPGSPAGPGKATPGLPRVPAGRRPMAP
jgi:hypothetical protein